MYAFIHIATHSAGTNGYYAPRKRGTIDVWHASDGKRYVYKKPDPEIPALIVKHEILNAWDSQGQAHRMTGKFPIYKIESK
jgi:hypothetical protein